VLRECKQGGELTFQIQISEESDWLEVGPWFAALVSLGECIHSASDSGEKYRRILVSVPQADMASLALAIGFSRSAFLAQTNQAVEIELSDLQIGDVIQLRSLWSQSPHKLTAPKNIVGTVQSLDKSHPEHVFVTFQFDTGANPQRFKVLRRLCPTGSKDPLKHIRLFKLKEGVPQRAGKEPREFKSYPTSKEHFSAWIDRWENWEYQVDPTLLIFGSPTKIAEYGKPNFADSDLHRVFLGIESDSILNVARLDSLSSDQKPHFVNAVEQISRFPKKGRPAFKSLEAFPFVCLEGNAAIVALSDRPVLQEKCVIGLWETAKPNLQELALSSFLETSTRFKSIEDFSERLGWSEPAGVQCWGWSA
jgi:hypothetical protein